MVVRFTEPLDMQFMEEAAASLGEAGHKLRRALEALDRYEREHVTDAREANPSERSELIAVAGEALWGLVVQRELLGFRDQEFVAKNYDVPNEVWQAMGPRTRAASAD